MISLAAALVLGHAAMSFEDTVVVPVKEDIWVYPHASDPGGDNFLRAWGIGGKSVAPSAADAENYSYGYLRFDFDKVPTDKKLVGAYIWLKPTGVTELDKNAKDYPLEVRPLKGKFTEKGWGYDQVGNVCPSETEVYGTGIVAKAATDAAEYEIKVDLMDKKSKFAEAFGKMLKSKESMYVALTSKFDVSEQGMKGVYKVFSKDNDEKVRPKLVLKFE